MMSLLCAFFRVLCDITFRLSMAFVNLADKSSRAVCYFSFEQKVVVGFMLCPFDDHGRKCVISLPWPRFAQNMEHKPNECIYIGKEFNFGKPTCPPFHCFASAHAQ